ncbi:class I SAM-dependent methyltransferase [Sphingobacterium sp. BIGb0165]|uniref:class I SAM-dependent methyltransferase n=1 Tax=Sphingobacterium sp. BIGb0165 TaxID=2940615 RepID=UPI0021691B7B|nr:class I SAM-dependent methyltransferase [Sphingobacterium sp. BIGb0165]MCS4227350.1 SAM-dependent methyltransferase [Sphingobacterium sp. BIGb0165]
MSKNSIERFTDRVVDYEKFRPNYPKEIIQILKEKIGLDKKWLIADIGSGTGLSTQLFLENGNDVFAVEPNREMRESLVHHFKTCRNLIALNATAEDTSIESSCVDLIFAGQSFHWFDRTACYNEFNRILTKNGHIVLVWNQRDPTDAFQQEYEQFLRNHIPNYQSVSHKNICDDDLRRFFADRQMTKVSLPNQQVFDLKSFLGRVRSSSYFPKEGDENKSLYDDLRLLFEKYAISQRIVFKYITEIYIS